MGRRKCKRRWTAISANFSSCRESIETGRFEVTPHRPVPTHPAWARRFPLPQTINY